MTKFELMQLKKLLEKFEDDFLPWSPSVLAEIAAVLDHVQQCIDNYEVIDSENDEE